MKMKQNNILRIQKPKIQFYFAANGHKPDFEIITLKCKLNFQLHNFRRLSNQSFQI